MFRAAQGEKAAYAEINEHYRSTVLNYFRSLNGHCSQHDMDDMTQEVFIRGWEKKEQFTGESSVKTWLLGYAGNIYFEQRRRENRASRGARHKSERFCAIAPTPVSPPDIIENTERIQSLKEAVTGLPRDQQEIIKLRYHDGLSHKRASETLNCSEKAFKCRLYRIHQKLHDLLKST